MNERQRPPKSPAKTGGRTFSRRVIWFVSSILAIIALALVLVRPGSTPPTNLPPSTRNATNAALRSDATNSTSAARPVSVERLVGRWMRPDGGYVIEIRAAQSGGRLEAAYFNPNPIHVARAEWKHQGPRLGVFIELRDVNYPGSTYTLEMQPDEVRLAGTYFQAALSQTFDVEFVRMP